MNGILKIEVDTSVNFSKEYKILTTLNRTYDSWGIGSFTYIYIIGTIY